MASITVDIQAKVVGYEASLKAMKDAFSKIDPGSDIGKSLEKAIKYAEGQLKNLSKNLTPKASSDTQIDSIIEKTNRAGEAIQEVSVLMQKVGFDDIDFSSFENGIGNLMSTLRELEDELDSRVSKGLREAVTSSSEFTDSFSKLNIDVKDKSAGEIFEAISEKAQKAAEDTEAARIALETAQKNLTTQQGKLTQLESNPIYNKDSLKQDLQNIAEEYTKTFEDIKNQIQVGLRGLLGNNSVQADKLIENFMSGLNPQTLKDHLMQLKNELQKELSENNSAKDIYMALLGDEGRSGNAQAIATRLLSNLNQALPEIKQEFQNKLQEFISSLTNKEAGQITTLINSGDIEAARKATVQAIERAYDSVNGAVVKKRAEVLGALKDQETAKTNFDSAQQNQQYIEGVKASLQKQIDDLRTENSELLKKIEQLTSQIQEQKDAEVKHIRQTGAESGSKTNNFKVSTEEARMYRTELEQVQAKEKLIGKIEGVVQRWFSIYAAVRMVGNAIRSVISTVQELDKTITEIAIVTNMTQDELWGQMKNYTDMARQYAASISGVYQVSQLYYQQGLETADVMALTEQTLKMARISGLGYAEATDYMTNAVRSFKMEMTDAQRVVDVYSEIAASSATSTSELASAMSKTASSAQAVGSSFENTTAMMAVMIEATRESAENIGSAMKSIISRYGEMTANPAKLMDSEGQEMSLNKVDKALKSVGITIQDTNHQFRDFDDVITELAGKWDTIDTNTQRYIATVMAGNRQQSRFLALVSNGERLAELSEKAANSEDAATLQVLKTMDSIEAKTQQLKTSLQSLYTSTGIQNLFKGFLDIGNQIVKTFTQMPTILGAPIPAILKIGTTFASLANVVTTVFGLIKAKTQVQIAALNEQEQVAAQERVNITNIEYTEKDLIAEQTNAYIEARMHGLTETEAMEARERVKIAQQEAEQKRQAELGAINGKVGITKKNAGIALGLNIAGVALSTISGAISDKTQGSKITKGLTGIAGSAASMAGLGTMIAPGWGTAIGAALGTVMGIVENINFLFESAEAKAQRLKEAATEANNTYLQKKEDYRSLDEQIKKLKELEKARYDSTEANEEYLQASNALASSYPELIGYIDQEGNAIVNLANNYDVLANARLTAQQAAIDAAEASARQAENAYNTAVKERNKNRSHTAENWLNDQLTEQDLAKWTDVGIGTTELPANTRKNLLKNIGQQFREKAISGNEQINNDYDLLAMINNLISDDQANLDFFNEQIEKEKENLQRIKSENPEDELIQAYFSLIESLTGNLLSVDQDISQKSNIVDATNKAAIANATYWTSQAKLADEKENADFLNEFENVNDIISSYVNSRFKAFKKVNTDEQGEATIDFKEGETWYSKFRDATEGGLNQSYEIIYSQIQTLWNNLGTSIRQNDFNKLIANRGIYSEDQFAKIIQDKYGINANSELGQSLLQYYDTAFKWENFDNAITKRQEAGSQLDINWLYKFNGLLDSLSSTELQNILDVYDNVEKQIENKNISQELGQSILDKYLNIWDTMYEEQWDNEALEEAQALLLNADLFSLSGLDDFRKVVASSGLNEEQQKALTESAESFSNLIPKNFTTEIASFTQKVTSNIEDFEKAISNAAKGMDLKTATELAQKLGKSLSDFDFKDGKFFFDDFATIKDAYLGENTELKSDIEKEARLLKEKYSNGMVENATQNLSNIFTSFDQGLRAIQDVEESLENLESAGFLNEAGFNKEEILQYYKEYQLSAERKSMSFVDWVEKNIDKQLAESLEAIDKYTNDQIARAALSTGDFTHFLDQVLPSNSRENAEKRAQLQQSLKSGNIDTVLASFPEYASDILKYYQNINKNVYDKLISGLDSQQYINADEFSAETLQSLETAGLVEKISGEGSTAIYKTLDQMTDEQLDLFAQTIANSNLVKADKDKMLASIHTEKYEDNIYEGLSGVVDNFDKFSYEAGQKLANSLGTSVESLITDTTFKVDKAGNLSIEYSEVYSKLNEALLGGLIDNKQFNELSAKLSQHKTDTDTNNIIRNIISNRDKITEENIGQLASALNSTYGRVIQDYNLQQNDDGTYRMSLDTLWNQFAGQMNDTLTEYVASEIDKVISSMTNLSADQSKGYTSIESIQKYADSLKQQGITKIDGTDFDLKDLFEYNDTLQAYQLTTTGIIAQIASVKAQIQPLIGEQRAIAEQFMQDTAKQFANNIDLQSLVSADLGSIESEKATEAIIKAVEDYNAILIAMADEGEKIDTIDANTLIESIGTGGKAAVVAAQKIAEAQGRTLSADEIESYYNREISHYINVIDQVTARPGEIIDAITAAVIGLDNAEQLGTTGQYVVKTAANLYEAYNKLLQRMAATGEATLSDLNKVTGLALDNKDGQQVAIDALGDAANLTYSRLGEIFTSANKLMTEELVQDWTDKGLIKALGGNKIQITDFAKFADLMGFDTGSPEYVSAFKTYNESLIDMNRQAERNILEEAQNLGNMKAGDWVDLTQLSDTLNQTIIDSISHTGGNFDITALNQLNSILMGYGARLENGILKTVDGANIPAIIQEITNSVQQYGNLSEAELAQLADTLKEVLKSYADLISGAVEGSLSNEGAQQLSQWSESLGLGKLNFQETTQGLKLATDQAYRLYQEISKIDALQGRVVFDNLAESLRSDKGGDFSNATATMAATARVQQQIANTNAEMQEIYAKVEGNISRLTDSDKNRLAVLERQSAALKDQLGTYDQLAQEMAWSNMDNPDSYNFMNRDLPNVFQGPINYWNSIGEAFGAMREAGQSGKMEIQDFYNIVTEMSNLAAATGTSIEFMGQSINGDLESAANLIDAGFQSLSNVDGKGVQIDMGKLATNLQTGATNMGEGFDDAIHQMAESQVHMLDGMIKLMETIVAMEKLGQVDVDNNGLLSIGEIFKDDGSFTQMFDQVRDYLSNSEELQPLLDNLGVNGVKLRDLLSKDQDIWRDAGISEQQYAQIMSAFYQAAQSDNYDLDNLISSVMNVLSGSGQVFSYYDENGVETVIDAVSGRTYTVNWNDEEDKQRIYDAFTAAGYNEVPSDEEIRKILDQGHAGQLTGEALVAYEITYGLIKEYTVKDKDGNDTGETVWKDSYGNTYKDEKEAVIGQAFAKQQGKAIGERETTILKPDDSSVQSQTFQLETGLAYKLTVTANGQEHYTTKTDDGYVASGSTYDEMITDLLNHVSQQKYSGKNFDELSEQEQIEVQREVNILVTPDVIFKSGGKEITNPAEDPDIRRGLTEFFNRGQEGMKRRIQEITDKDGKKSYKINLYNGKNIEVQAENPDAAIQKVQDALDPLITSISTAITTAFTSLNNQGGNAIQEAIASAIRSALGINTGEGAGGEGGNKLPIPEVTLAPQGLKIDISQAGEPVLDGVDEETQNVEIGEVSLAPDSVKVNASAESIDVTTLEEQIKAALTGFEIEVPIKPVTISNPTPDSSNSNSQPEVKSSTIDMVVNLDDTEAKSKIEELITEVEETEEKPVEANVESAIRAVNFLTNGIKSTTTKPVNADVSAAVKAVSWLVQQIQNETKKPISITPNFTEEWKSLMTFLNDPNSIIKTVKYNGVKTGWHPSDGLGDKAGNVALAKGQSGNALAAGRTLMGELGPELVVSKGRYFVVGQAGPEMVNLAPDAVVFNHLQTRQLLSKGKASSRGRAVTNERTATALATGNSSGPAMVSASAALAALKQLRSMWQSLLDASLSDLGAMPGGNGGGGGGGGGGDNKFYTGVNFEVEQWYNWLKEIEATQNNINKLTKQYTLLEKQNKGSKALTNNLKEQAKYLQQNVQTRQALVEEQKKERNRQLNSVKNTALSAFYRVDRENNRLALGDDKRYLNYISKYLPENLAQTLYGGKTASLKIVTSEPVKDENGNLTDDRQDVSLDVNIPKSGLALLNELSRQDETTGEMAYSAAQQYEILKRLGFEEFMTIDPQGNRIDTSTDEGKQTAVQNFIDEVNGAKDSVDSLNDSIREQEDSILDDKIAIQEINDQFNEMAKRIQGVTESLELWYNTTRKLSSEQNELNLLVAKFNNLQNLGGKNRTQDLAKNLRQRVEVTEKQKETNAEELKLLNEQRKIESQKIKNSNLITKGIYKKDEYGNLVYNDTDDTFRKQIKEAAKSSKASVKNGEATFSVTNRNIKLDDSGNYIKDLSQYSSAQLKQLGYNTPEEKKAAKKTGLTKQDRTNAAKALKKFSGKKNLTTSQKAERDQYKAIINAYDNGLNNLQERQTKVSLDTTDPKKFFEKLTRTDANGNSIFTALQQTEILEQAGFTEELENFGKKQGLFNSWATASEEQRNEATKGYLENLKEIPEVYNEIIQKMKEGEIKSVEYNGDTIEYNNQLKELAHVAAGIQNPFEKWHDWIRKVTEEQNKLNLKTKEYSNLQKDLDNKARTNGLMLGKNLLAQKALLEQEKETNTLYQTARETALRRDYISQLQPKTSKGKENPKYNETLAKVFTYDKNNGLQFADTTFRQKSNLNIKGITLGKKDKNGAYTYKDTKDFTFSGASTAQELIEKITKQNADKSMKYNVSQQYAILKAYGFDSLMQYDESGEKLIENIENPTKEEIERAVPAFLNYLKNFQEGIDGERDEIQSLAEQGLDIESSLTDIKQAILDNEISLENALEKAIETREQRQIDNLKEQRDAMSKAADNFVNGLKDQLEKERAMYDKQENQDELTKLQRQLAILQRSGGSTSQIRSLQEQIKSQQKDMYFDEREEQIDAVKEASDRQIEKMDQQIELMERALEYSKENGLYWKEVRELMEKSDTTMVKFLEKYSEDFASLSELQKSVTRRENSELTREYTTIRDANDFQLKANKKGVGTLLRNSKGVYGDSNVKFDSAEKVTVHGYTEDSERGVLLQVFSDKGKARYIPITSFTKEEQKNIQKAIQDKQIKKIEKFAGGGLINYTGPAWVDGSKSKPESILSAEQTNFLRNDFFKEMSSFSETMNKISQIFSNSNNIVNSIDGQGGITIGQLDFVMKVDSISNDYDARRAGQMAFDEMVRIARKAGNNSISRR